MNHNLWSSVAARVIAVTFVIAGVTACDRQRDGVERAAESSPSAQVIGTVPAGPTQDTAGTTAVAGGTTEMSKAVESRSMPLPGQPNDHSNLAAKPSENVETKEVLKSTEMAKRANDEPALDSRGAGK